MLGFLLCLPPGEHLSADVLYRPRIPDDVAVEFDIRAQWIHPGEKTPDVYFQAHMVASGNKYKITGQWVNGKPPRAFELSYDGHSFTTYQSEMAWAIISKKGSHTNMYPLPLMATSFAGPYGPYAFLQGDNDSAFTSYWSTNQNIEDSNSWGLVEQAAITTPEKGKTHLNISFKGDAHGSYTDQIDCVDGYPMIVERTGIVDKKFRTKLVYKTKELGRLKLGNADFLYPQKAEVQGWMNDKFVATLNIAITAHLSEKKGADLSQLFLFDLGRAKAIEDEDSHKVIAGPK